MFYRCKNCGGNVLFDPVKKKMVCDSCHSEDSGQLISQEKLHTCNNCGAQLELKDNVLAERCPYCKTSIILEDRMEEEYRPGLVVPFAIDRHTAAQKLLDNFKNKLCLPGNFCSAASLEHMEGMYVPFWMYDLCAHVDFEGEGKKIRVWTEGDYECTETKYYRVSREFQANYDKLPVDASPEKDDGLMDLLEPYEYEELIGFEPEYLSGFSADVWEESKEQLRPRAEQKANRFSEEYLREMTSEYDSVSADHGGHKIIENTERGTSYAFLPVWRYVYGYGGKNYEFYVNGQTGKTIGAPPISKGKAFGMSAALFASLCFCLRMICFFLEVL